MRNYVYIRSKHSYDPRFLRLTSGPFYGFQWRHKDHLGRLHRERNRRREALYAAGTCSETIQSQGMTLSTAIVDLKTSFEEGQAFVALGRARSLGVEGLESLGDTGNSMSGNVQVREFLHEKFPLNSSTTS